MLQYCTGYSAHLELPSGSIEVVASEDILEGIFRV
jgi:hypothetical protein